MSEKSARFTGIFFIWLPSLTWNTKKIYRILGHDNKHYYTKFGNHRYKNLENKVFYTHTKKNLALPNFNKAKIENSASNIFFPFISSLFVPSLIKTKSNLQEEIDLNKILKIQNPVPNIFCPYIGSYVNQLFRLN